MRATSCLPTALVAVASLLVSDRSPAAPPPAEAVPRISVAGTIPIPGEVVGADGEPVAVTGVSGVTWLGADRWIAVTDTGVALVEFTLAVDAAGAPLAIRDARAVRFAVRHDYEDVTPCPPELARRSADGGRCLIVCEEDTPALHVVNATGALVGGLPLPRPLAARRPNRGPEALCTSADRRAVWTANEEALPDDGPAPAPGSGTVVRIAEIPLAGGAPGRQIAYAVDPPHASLRFGAGEVYSGVVALAALPDGRLLVLERSASLGLPPFENRIYVVDPATAVDVADVPQDLAERPDTHVAKRLAWRGTLGCNLEGLALGPSLAGGGTALVAVADAGGVDALSQLVVLRMDAPVTSP